MKILVSSIVDLRKSAHNSRLHQFIKLLSNRHEITVLSINDWWKAKWDDKTAEYNNYFEDTFSRIKILYITDKQLSPILQEIFSVGTVNGILKQIDYRDFDVHFNYNTLISGYVVAKKMESAGINTVYDLADDLPEMIRTSPQISDILKPIGGFVGDLAVDKNIHISKKVTVTTDSLQVSCKVPQNKSELIPNGVDTKLFAECSEDEIKKELGINNSFVVGHVGVLREWIDLETLFLAVKQLSEKLNIKLLMVGGGIGYNDSVELAERHNLNKNIIFTGTVPYTRVPKYISCMDACIVPFKLDAVSQNSLPLKLFEYMACKKPVISTKVEGIMAAVQNRVLYASSSKEYQDRILELYQDKEIRNRLGSEGRDFVQKNYQWSDIALRLEKVLEEARGM